MVKRTGPTNEVLKDVIVKLREAASKQKVSIWKRVASDLEKSSRIRRKVNVYKFNCVKDGEVAVVPGTVLGNGTFDKKITVAAFKFSDAALNKINKTGKAISILDLIKSNPKGKKVRIVG